MELTGDPAGLAPALQRPHDIQGDDWERLATRSGAWWLRWFLTQPTIGERIARLPSTIPTSLRDGRGNDTEAVVT